MFPPSPVSGVGGYCTHFTEEKLRSQKVDLLAKATRPVRDTAKGLSGPRREAGGARARGELTRAGNRVALASAQSS